MWLFFLAYLLAAIGIVPHSIYLSAYIHQVLDQPVAFSTMVYAIYGVGRPHRWSGLRHPGPVHRRRDTP